MDKTNYDFQITIERRNIDEIDKQIYKCLLDRFKHIQRIAEVKKEFGTMELSDTRQKEILEKLHQWSRKDGLPLSLVDEIYRIIFEFSVLFLNL